MDNNFAGLSLEEIQASAMADLDIENTKTKENTKASVKTNDKDENKLNNSERYLNLTDIQIMMNIYEKFKFFSETYFSYLKDIERIKKELQDGVDDVRNTIEQLQDQRKKVEELCNENKLTLDDNNTYGENHTSYWDLKQLIGSSVIDLFIYYGISPAKKSKCQKACQEEINFIRSAIEKNINRMSKLEMEKQAEISRIGNDCTLKDGKEKSKISDLLREISMYINSKDLKELNNYWDEYLQKYQISTLLKYNPDKNNSNLCGCLGFIHKHIPMSENLSAYISKEFKNNNFFFMSNNEMVIQIPIFDVLTDSSNKYYINGSSAKDIQRGLQAYMLRLLSNSVLNEYDFVLMDPISNGKSFLDAIGLVHDDGYGIANNIQCDKNEIAKALSEVSNKIKEINQTIKGYSSIYDYNENYPDNKINTTVFIAYNFCDEYYREDLLSPIFDNADKCGITIFAITPFSGSYSIEKVKKVVDSYPHDSILYGNNTMILNSLDEFVFTKEHSNTVEWIDQYNETMKKGIQICNTYKDIKNKLPDFYSLDSTVGLHIPFAVDNKNHIVNFNLAVSMCYHAFISGQTGIGKSVLLHSIVSSVIRNYHPDDVELWLVDYKAVEFHEYVANQPPHIKLVGLDRSTEFTKSVLDKIYSTMEERKRIIMESGFQKIEEYKSHYGKNSMPRILLIIDEAHVLSQHLSEDDKYKQLFENILSEYRAFGLSVILSDQAYKNSMKGITDKGRDQIGVRVAMKNSMEEIQGTLEVDHTYYQDSNLKNKINTLSTGDAIFRWNEAIDDGTARLHLDKVKCIYANRDDDRKSIIDKSRELIKNTEFKPKETFLIVGKDRSSVFDKENPFDLMQTLDEIPKSFNINIGTPSSLEPTHKITMRRKKSSNIIFVCNNEEMQVSVSFFAALNFSKLFNMNIFIMAAEDRINDDFKEYFLKVFSDKVFIAETETQYDEALDKIKASDKCFVLWFGIDEIIDGMEMHDKSTDKQRFNAFGSGNDFTDLDDILNNSKISSQIKDVKDVKIYDRSDEIIELLDKGSAFGKFSLVVSDSMREIAVKKSIKMEFFEHKLAFNISSDESLYLFGKSRTIEIDSELKVSTVIYSDGLEYNILRPYILEDKLKDYFE